MLKLGCTVPNLSNICLNKSSGAEFYPFTETDKDLLQKIQEDTVGSPSIVFTPKAVVDETFIPDSRSICKSIVGIEASHLYLYSYASPCQQDYTRDGKMSQKLIDLDLNRTNPETLRTWLCHISRDKDPTVKLRVSTQELRKRLIVSR